MLRGTIPVLLFASFAANAQTFTSQLWRDITPVYSRTIQHPFLTGLADGSLPRERFHFFLLQDSLYLSSFAQALNFLAAKAPRQEWSAVLARHSIEAIEAERKLHASILAGYGVKQADMDRTEMAPVNAAYTNHLLASVQALTFTEGLAAMLPCYWVYWEVGKELRKQGSKNPDYQKWINQYASEDFGATVRQVLRMMDESAASAPESVRRNARRLFERSARYEYMFWDMAWRMEQWAP
jgi:thiaminase/transcriptional activator TenA